MLISKRALRRLSTTRKATHVFSKITNFSESDSVPKISVYADLTCKNARIMNSPFNLTAPSGMKTNYTKKCFIVLNGLSCVIVRMCIVNIYIFFFSPPVACGFATRLRVMASLYRASRSHSLDTPPNNTHTRQTPMLTVGFESAVQASEQS